MKPIKKSDIIMLTILIVVVLAFIFYSDADGAQKKWVKFCAVKPVVVRVDGGYNIGCKSTIVKQTSVSTPTPYIIPGLEPINPYP